MTMQPFTMWLPGYHHSPQPTYQDCTFVLLQAMYDVFVFFVIAYPSIMASPQQSPSFTAALAEEQQSKHMVACA